MGRQAEGRTCLLGKSAASGCNGRFCLCRPDVLPADDLALLTAAQKVKRLATRPTAGVLRAMAEPWRPWRSVAARLLWHYYRQAPATE